MAIACPSGSIRVAIRVGGVSLSGRMRCKQEEGKAASPIRLYYTRVVVVGWFTRTCFHVLLSVVVLFCFRSKFFSSDPVVWPTLFHRPHNKVVILSNPVLWLKENRTDFFTRSIFRIEIIFQFDSRSPPIQTHTHKSFHRLIECGSVSSLSYFFGTRTETPNSRQTVERRSILPSSARSLLSGECLFPFPPSYKIYIYTHFAPCTLLLEEELFLGQGQKFLRVYVRVFGSSWVMCVSVHLELFQ